jgi:carboxyl-terminal processing protease
MKRFRCTPLIWVFAIILLALSSWVPRFGSGAHAEDCAPAVSTEGVQRNSAEFAKLFDAVTDKVERTFYDPARLKQIDWAARAKAIRPCVLSAISVEEAASQINSLLSTLKASHTGLFTPDQYEYYIILDIVGVWGAGPDLANRRLCGSPCYPGIGAFTRQIGARHFVDGVLEGSSAEQAGLKYGDEVVSVDGASYTPVAAFRDKVGQTVELRVRRSANAEPEQVKIPVAWIKPREAFSKATWASVRVIERDGLRAGYIHIWALHDSSSFRTAMRNLDPDMLPKDHAKPLDSLIIDMRGRVGGSALAVTQNLEFLDTDRRPYFGDWRTIGGSGNGGQLASPGPFNRPFRGRSALLTDEHTRSAGEIMAYGYQHSGFGFVVGTPTAGAVLSGDLSIMPGDLLLYVAFIRHEFDGRLLEGVGVIPDHRVERPLPYATGADPVLDTAVDLLGQQARQAGAGTTTPR